MDMRGQFTVVFALFEVVFKFDLFNSLTDHYHLQTFMYITNEKSMWCVNTLIMLYAEGRVMHELIKGIYRGGATGAMAPAESQLALGFSRSLTLAYSKHFIGR